MPYIIAGLVLLFLFFVKLVKDGLIKENARLRNKLKSAFSDAPGWTFLVTYKRNNCESWILTFNKGTDFKRWLKTQESYGFSVDVLTKEWGMELCIDTHGLAGWEREEAE